ncbi:MAG: DoxX family protein [Verrucomicrobia bacterium]|nr:DoxX family protein [Verrucomicrobiota bacterium]MBS0645738.1 DoxX family protein [Verrucomicrobiota bacterium]
MRAFLVLVGRIFLSSLFLTGAYWHLVNWEAGLQKIKKTAVYYPDLVLILSTLLLFLGGISLLLGYKTRLGAFFLLIEVIATAVIFDRFWEIRGAEMMLVLLSFLTRMAVCGGLFLLLSNGPGSISVDYRLLRKQN